MFLGGVVVVIIVIVTFVVCVTERVSYKPPYLLLIYLFS